jgi:hypothetical protein
MLETVRAQAQLRDDNLLLGVRISPDARGCAPTSS